MNGLSIAQEYLLCSLNEKGKLPLIGKEVPACILASGLIELKIGGSIQIDEKDKVTVTGGLGEDKYYLKSLYDWLQKSSPVKLDKIAREYCLSITEKRLNEIVTDIGTSLVSGGCAVSRTGGFLAGRPDFLPDRDEVDKVIQKIRAELLEDGVMSDETVALVSLLQKGGQIKKYFSGYESKQLKSRLKEIMEEPSNLLVKQTLEYVETTMAALIAVFTTV
jgi:hypothetical protein